MKRREQVASTITPDGLHVELFEHDGEYSIEIDYETLMCSRAPGSEEALASLAAAELEGIPRPHVMIGGLGLGFTVAAAVDAFPPGASVVVVEFFEAIVDWNRKFDFQKNTPLSDPRVSVEVADVFDYLNAAPRPFDAILLDVDNGPEAWCLASNDRLYHDQGLTRIRRALAPDGLLVVWSAVESPAFMKRLDSAGFDARSESVRSRGRKGSRHTLFVARA